MSGSDKQELKFLFIKKKINISLQLSAKNLQVEILYTVEKRWPEIISDHFSRMKNQVI